MKKWLLSLVLLVAMLFTACENGLSIKNQLTTNLFTTAEQETLKEYAESLKTNFDITYEVTSEKFQVNGTAKAEYESFVKGDKIQVNVTKENKYFTYTVKKNGTILVDKTKKSFSLEEALKAKKVLYTKEETTWVYDPSKNGSREVEYIEETYDDNSSTRYIKNADGSKGQIIGESTSANGVREEKEYDMARNLYSEGHYGNGEYWKIEYFKWVYDFSKNNGTKVVAYIDFGGQGSKTYLYTNGIRGVVIGESTEGPEYHSKEYDITGKVLVSESVYSNGSGYWMNYYQTEFIYLDGEFKEASVIRKGYNNADAGKYETYRKNPNGSKGTLAILEENGNKTYYKEDGATVVEYELKPLVGTLAYTDAEYNQLETTVRNSFGTGVKSFAKDGNNIKTEVEYTEDGETELSEVILVKASSFYGYNVYSEGKLVHFEKFSTFSKLIEALERD